MTTMKRGRKICNALRDVRRQIAAANDIPYETTDCHHEGECLGTCPKCEAEVRYIERELSLRRAAGKAVSLVGLSLGISAAFASCANQPAKKTNPSAINQMEEKTENQKTHSNPIRELEDTREIDTDLVEIETNETWTDCEGDVEIEEIELTMGDSNDEVIIDLSEEDFSQKEEPTPPNDRIYTVVDQQPEFPGGEAAMMAYIKSNLKYPAFASENGIQGRVTLSFVVEKDGSISNIEILHSPAEELNQEAIRLVKTMPKWKPGVLKGEKVRVKYVLPVTFRLQ